MAIFPEGPSGLYRTWRAESTHLCLRKSAHPDNQPLKLRLHYAMSFAQTHTGDIFDERILKISSPGET